MLDEMIVDADICIKLGGSDKYRFLEQLLPKISRTIYIHKYTRSEVMMPPSAKHQLDTLVSEGQVCVLDEASLTSAELTVYNMAYDTLARVMIDSSRPRKNKGEVCALSMAQAKMIPIFATDEKQLQPIIDRLLNTGNHDITCLRITDIVEKVQNGEIEGISRKEAKALWRIAGKDKDVFDSTIWPL